jgi:hypothetical protein
MKLESQVCDLLLLVVVLGHTVLVALQRHGEGLPENSQTGSAAVAVDLHDLLRPMIDRAPVARRLAASRHVTSFRTRDGYHAVPLT